MKVKNVSCTDEVDLELLRRYQAGDDSAFVELLELHAGFFKKWVRRVLNKAPWANWDDIMQEAHFGFYRAAKNYDFSKRGNFHVLARKYGRKMFDSREVKLVKRTLQENFNKVIAAQDRLLGKLDRAPTLVELSEEAELTVRQVKTALNLVGVFPFPLEEAEGVLGSEDPYTLQLLSDVIAQLSPEHVDVIILHDLYGHTYREIAEVMGKSEEAIKKSHERAIKTGRVIIEGKGKRKDGT